MMLDFPLPCAVAPERAGGILVSVMEDWLGASAVWALLALVSLALAAQQATLHVDVKLVSVFVNVTDRNGAVVGGLKREDFALTEDGRPQRIAVFERQSELPLNLTLAIDTSGSVRKDLAVESDAAKRFARALLRP